MKISNPYWKDRLEGRMPPDLAREIEVFETELELKRQGKIDDRVLAETRLRRGVYGQRYDNGQRHDGTQVRSFYLFNQLAQGLPAFFRIEGVSQGAPQGEQIFQHRAVPIGQPKFQDFPQHA